MSSSHASEAWTTYTYTEDVRHRINDCASTPTLSRNNTTLQSSIYPFYQKPRVLRLGFYYCLSIPFFSLSFCRIAPPLPPRTPRNALPPHEHQRNEWKLEFKIILYLIKIPTHIPEAVRHIQSTARTVRERTLDNLPDSVVVGSRYHPIWPRMWW